MQTPPRTVRCINSWGDPVQTGTGLTAVASDVMNTVTNGDALRTIDQLKFRDPDHFRAGKLHNHVNECETLLDDTPTPQQNRVLTWIRGKVSIFEYFRPFKGQTYDSARPPPAQFKNNPLCQQFADFVSNTLLQHVQTGAVSLLGRIEDVAPPYLVLPLTIEPTKPRLCHDVRFLNLWMTDIPFKLDSVTHLPQYVPKDTYQTVLDDKSGYDHLLLTEASETYFAAQSAIFIVAYYLVWLGYFLGLSKSISNPSQIVPYLGFLLDSVEKAFHLIPWKQEKFLELLCSVLTHSTVSVKTLQRLAGKCISFSLAVAGAQLFTREMNLAISKGLHTHRTVRIDTRLREELEHWLFLETWNQPLPWREECHVRISIATDASGSGWGVSVGIEENNTTSDYWTEDERKYDIAAKEALALNKTLEAFSDFLQNKWVDAQVDNKAVITACQQREEFGGPHGHTCDLMALDSNTMRDLNGSLLPHFTPTPTPASSGVNIFAQNLRKSVRYLDWPYIFPPPILIGPLLRFLRAEECNCTLVALITYPRQYWWPILQRHTAKSLCLAQAGESNALLIPSHNGFVPQHATPGELWAFSLEFNEEDQ
ncbi:Hypothetical predicted protein [Paramuricea clavata]|uniref:Reverse transcriptase RNase H-like domain-containing protein n=1 Tax=Paramuricea clavata TaxID=317549 RepID=A0A6S7GZ51_PARCT|nr:Hypothetical predicted protein [Paramuricea clavata]